MKLRENDDVLEELGLVLTFNTTAEAQKHFTKEKGQKEAGYNLLWYHPGFFISSL